MIELTIKLSLKMIRFPHSEISGSKVARYLTEAYRHQAASFIALKSQGIHHILLNFLLGNLRTTSKFSVTITENFILHPVILYDNRNKSTSSEKTHNYLCSGVGFSCQFSSCSDLNLYLDFFQKKSAFLKSSSRYNKTS